MGEGDHSSDPLWQRLSVYSIGPDTAEFTFVQRLARENGWSASHAERVMEEYRRFCFLAMRAGHFVTPSDAVDQAWHLHLTYSRDYWDRFCPEVLQSMLHHGPTAGGDMERQRYYDQYAETLASYERVFGPSPPEIWPAAAQRLYRDPLAWRVDPARFYIVEKRVVWAVTLLALLAIIGIFVLLMT